MVVLERTKIVGVIVVILLLAGCSQDTTVKQQEVYSMQVHYLEIVTNDVETVCSTYAKACGAQFGEPDAMLGNARTASLPGGGMVGVRAPMRADEAPVVRPYWLVDDLEAAVSEAEKAGCEIAIPSMEIPSHGTIAIYIQGGIQHGLWQLKE